MPEARNNRSATELFRGFDKTLQHYLIDRPRAYFEVIHRKLRDIPQTNFELGCDFAEQGQWLDAIFRFKLALRFRPNFAQAWHNLGTCYLRVGRKQEAKAAFRQALLLKPNHTEALFMMASLDPHGVPASARPSRMPKDMVVKFFTRLAPVYDDVQRNNGYQGDRVVADAVKPFMKATEKLNVVDIGCGTGLMSRPWRQSAASITGIDFTPAMVEAAHGIKVGAQMLFERMLADDIYALADDAIAEGSIDLVLCGDTAQFLGELSVPMAKMARMLKPSGVLAITIEPLDAPAGFAVNAERGRFGHHPEYVKRTGALLGLTLAKDTRVNLYPQIPGQLFIFTKGT